MGSTTDSSAPTTAPTSDSKSSVPPFSYFANAQSEFKPPLIANGNAFLGDVFSSDRPTNPISAGFYRLEPGPELIYTYTYDEMKILLEGDMQISQLKDANGEDVVKDEVDAKKGDTFFFPKGAVVRFRTREGGLAWFCGQRGRDGA
ncbi:MAG: hypothetical protein L6R38_002601 [Xanthoria sp. 2 TBL-2021]|nr:MAG: hypothetical protein L6R38_002601 [Xanthoria sp. 2 TBL-2021]